MILCLILAVLAGLGWDRYTDLLKKYNALQQKHERLNKIYLDLTGK